MSHIFENATWANENFGSIDFGDVRLNERLVTTVNRMTNKPESSIPQQMEGWAEVIGCYRFFNNPKVTHSLVQSTHIRKTIEAAKNTDQVVLFIQDTSEIETGYGVTGAGPIGNHHGRGMMIHNCLAVKHGTNHDVIGLASQLIWERKDVVFHRNETRSKRNSRKGKESEVWLKTIKTLKRPPAKHRWVSVGDRTNDVYEFLAGSRNLGWEMVIRACQDRKIEVDGKETSLMTWVDSLKSEGEKVIETRKRGETKTRKITCNIAWGSVQITPPARVKGDNSTLTLSVVRCWNSEEGINWILYSSIEVTSLIEALEKIEWYACRWIIEEYHKCLKTGCRVEFRQLETTDALHPLVGILSIIALLMLHIRDEARSGDQISAQEVAPLLLIKIICKRYQLNASTMTVREFWRAVARLGGFLGRKSDGEPGWQTLWSGWLRLLDMWLGIISFQDISEPG